jgi:hypothetical protein
VSHISLYLNSPTQNPPFDSPDISHLDGEPLYAPFAVDYALFKPKPKVITQLLCHSLLTIRQPKNESEPFVATTFGEDHSAVNLYGGNHSTSNALGRFLPRWRRKNEAPTVDV